MSAPMTAEPLTMTAEREAHFRLIVQHHDVGAMGMYDVPVGLLAEIDALRARVGELEATEKQLKDFAMNRCALRVNGDDLCNIVGVHPVKWGFIKRDEAAAWDENPGQPDFFLTDVTEDDLRAALDAAREVKP